MKLLVSSNWDDKLIEGLSALSNVDTLYGQANSDEYGGGRSSLLLPFVAPDKMRSHIRKARAAGFGFTYIMNAACFENKPFGGEFEKRLRSHLDNICSMGVSGITATDVPLIRLIRKHYPQLKISLSVFARITSVTQARRFEELGVSDIVLSNLNDFEFIRAVCEAVSCDIVLLANLGCQIFCNDRTLHCYLDAHSSQSGHFSKGFNIDTHIIRCMVKKIENPESLLRMMFIRPEDVPLYEKLGVTTLKIVERFSPTDTLLKIVRSYNNGSFQGNLLDLVNGLGMVNRQSTFPNFSLLMSPMKVNLIKLIINFISILPFNVYIDNGALDGFKEEVMNSGVNCDTVNCEKCGRCRRYFKAAARYDEKARQKSLWSLRKMLKNIANSNVFRWSPF